MAAKFKYTENTKVFAVVTEGLAQAKETMGEYYCPCKLEKTEENICPCVEYRETATCHCTLYSE